jgi:hypothetical protein
MESKTGIEASAKLDHFFAPTLFYAQFAIGT